MKNKGVMAKIKIAGIVLVLATIAVLMICSSNKVTAGSTGDHNVTLDIGNVAPTVIYVEKVSPAGSVDPTSGATTEVITEIHARDTNGIGDISTVNVTYWFASGGETNRSDSLCVYSSDLGSNIANYTCTANMQFYDAGGTWTIVARANDTSAEMASNSTNAFTYNSLQDISISVSTIQFGTVTMGGSNAKATNDPQIITNIGNTNIATVNVTGYNIKHLTLADNIPATSFKVGAADDCNGNAMSNGVSKEITGIIITKGAASTDNMYYCIPSVPSGLSNGNYAATSNWIVTSIV